MSLSTFAAESRRPLDVALDLGNTPPSSAPPTMPATATTTAGAGPSLSSAGSSTPFVEAEAAADRFFPDGRADHYGMWQGRGALDAASQQWTGSAEFGSRDLGWGGVTVSGVSASAGARGASVDGAVVRLEADLGAYGSGRVDAFQAGAAVSVVQADGSRGLGMGAGANIAAGEATYDRGGFRATVGLSAGVGAGAGLGLRDADGDGRTELCASVSAGPVTAGTCYEPYTVAEGAWRLGERGVNFVAGLMRP